MPDIRRWLSPCVFLALLMSTPLAFSQHNSGFRTPSGNIACDVYDGFLRCDIREIQGQIPPPPKDCDLDWGHFFGMGQKGPASRLCAGDTVFAQQPILAYGKTWKYQGFTCRSEAQGLTCRNAQKKGWFLNKVQQKLF